MSLFGGLVERLGPLVAGPIEDAVWEKIPEEWRPEVSLALAVGASELYAQIKAVHSAPLEGVWSELLKDAKAHLDAALGEGQFEKIDQYVKVGSG